MKSQWPDGSIEYGHQVKEYSKLVVNKDSD